MPGMGPPPKHPSQRRRRNADVAMTRLPQKRTGRIPPWPLDDDPEPAELTLWKDLWRRPPSVLWERAGCFTEVAQYARLMVKAATGRVDASAEARQIGDRLGLTPLALLRLRCEVATDEVSDQRADKADRPKRLSAVDLEARSA